MNEKDARQWLRTYKRLRSFGFAGRFVADEREQFKKEQQGNENILDWCVRKALEALQHE